MVFDAGRDVGPIQLTWFTIVKLPYNGILKKSRLIVLLAFHVKKSLKILWSAKIDGFNLV